MGINVQVSRDYRQVGFCSPAVRLYCAKRAANLWPHVRSISPTARRDKTEIVMFCWYVIGFLGFLKHYRVNLSRSAPEILPRCIAVHKVSRQDTKLSALLIWARKVWVISDRLIFLGFQNKLGVWKIIYSSYITYLPWSRTFHKHVSVIDITPNSCSTYVQG